MSVECKEVTLKDVPRRPIEVEGVVFKVPRWVNRVGGNGKYAGWKVILGAGSYTAYDDGRSPQASFEEIERVLEGWLATPAVAELLVVRRLKRTHHGFAKKSCRSEQFSRKRILTGQAGVSLTASGSTQVVVSVGIPDPERSGTRMIRLPALRWPSPLSSIHSYVNTGVALRRWAEQKSSGGQVRALKAVSGSKIPREVMDLAATLPPPPITLFELQSFFNKN